MKTSIKAFNVSDCDTLTVIVNNSLDSDADIAETILNGLRDNYIEFKQINKQELGIHADIPYTQVYADCKAFRVFCNIENGQRPCDKVKIVESLMKQMLQSDLHYIFITNDPVILRAIECYSDIMHIMCNLDIYTITETGEVVNMSNSEYGVTSLYEEMSAAYDFLDDLIRHKNSANT